MKQGQVTVDVPVKKFRKIRRRRNASSRYNPVVGWRPVTIYRRLRAAIWIGIDNKTRSAWKIKNDRQDLARLIGKYGPSTADILVRRSRRKGPRRDRAHWIRLLRMLEGCQFGLLPDPTTRAFLHVK